jgi:secreted trypsin-like serine protease
MRAKSILIWSVVLLALLVSEGSATASASNPTAEVINGNPVSGSSTRWDFIASLITDENDRVGSRLCGGSLIKPTWVLTAAHCYTTNEATPRFPHYAIFGAKDTSSGGEVVGVKGYYRYAGWNYDHATENDIMLLELDHAPAGITPVNLASPANEPVGGDPVSVAGWGASTGDPYTYPLALQEANVELSPGGTCENIWGLDPLQSLCASHPDGANTKITCYGDSGGPLLWDSPSGPVLAGITSAGPNGCITPPYTAIYTRVSSYRDWIASRISKRLDTGPAISFGTVAAGSTATREAFLEGDGPLPTTVSAIHIAGPGFKVISDACTGQVLARGERCAIGLSFTPAAAGTSVGSVTVDSDAEGNTRPIELSGSAPVAKIGSLSQPVEPFGYLVLSAAKAKKSGKAYASRVRLDYDAGIDTSGNLACGAEAKLQVRTTRATWRVVGRSAPRRVARSCTASFSVRLAKSAIGKKFNFKVSVGRTLGVPAASASHSIRFR